jgi:hypothetical protein
MASSKRFGFSTGALAKGDFERALQLLRRDRVQVVELSALREHELPRLADAIREIDLSEFSYVSVHAPSNRQRLSEIEVCRLLEGAASRGIPIVLHPDTIEDPQNWRAFGRLLLIENLDKRKAIGRTAAELSEIFSRLPEARFCCDIAHARQVDPTMAEAADMLRIFKLQLVQIHASGLSSKSMHAPLSAAAGYAIEQVADLIPEFVPVILESPVTEDALESEIHFAERAFSPWLTRLYADIDSALDQARPTRREQALAFLSLLALTNTRLSEFEHVIQHLPSGRAFARGDVFVGAPYLLDSLTEAQKADLRQYLSQRLNAVTTEFPDLKERFSAQFS